MTKDQAILILIMFKAQNFDRLVSDFVDIELASQDLKVGDLRIVDEYGAVWLDDTDGWFFCIDCGENYMSKITRKRNNGVTYTSTDFNFFDYISFEDKV